VADGAVQLGLAGLPVGEQLPFVLPDPALPRASYALSKVVAEALFRHAAGATRVRIGRYHNIYGPRMGHDHVIPQLIERALARRDPFPVYGVDQTRSFCYVQDAVEGTVGLMRLSTPDPVVANIGNDQQEIRIGRLVELILELAGHRPAVQAHDPPPGSPPRRRPDLTALRAATGYRPRVPLAEGVRATFDWYAAAATRPGSVPPAPARGRR
jgi:UDP-glucose 4-epimerase/UDP-glucuronate decarboxylase